MEISLWQVIGNSVELFLSSPMEASVGKKQQVLEMISATFYGNEECTPLRTKSLMRNSNSLQVILYKLLLHGMMHLFIALITEQKA